MHHRHAPPPPPPPNNPHRHINTYTFRRCRIEIGVIRQAGGVTDSHCCAGKLLSPDREPRLWPSSLCIILFLVPPPSRGDAEGPRRPHRDD